MTEPSAGQSTPPAPSPAAPPQAAGPLNQLQPFAASAEDDNFLRHLGLPFFYRHAPSPQIRRPMFWLAALGILGLVFFNFCMLPYERGTLMYMIRKSIFGLNTYHTFEQGYDSLFSQLVIIALIFSSMIAPIVATMSFVNERASGTLEFLRLAPLSNLSIVLGKTVPPAYPLHLVSGMMLALSIVFGIAAGHDTSKVLLTVLCCVLLIMTTLAIGAFCATMSALFKGVAAVLALIGIGSLVMFLPIAMWQESRMEFLGFISPWALLDAFFGGMRQWRSGPLDAAAPFFGVSWGAVYFMLLFHGCATAVFLWAATRKLQAAENTALPKFGWLSVWLFILIVALGAKFNPYIARWAGMPAFMTTGYMHMTAILTLAGIPLILLVLLDHPHHREALLTRECERLAGREKGRESDWRRLSHALFTFALSGMTGTLIILCVSTYQNSNNPIGVAVMFAALLTFLTFLIGVAIEVAVIGFTSPWSRVSMAVLLIAAQCAAVIVPLVHGVSASERFFQAANATVYHYQMLEQRAADKLNPPAKPRAYNDYWYDSARTDPAAQMYLEDIHSKMDAINLLDKYRHDSLSFFMRWHAGAVFGYLLLWLGVVAGMFFWRRKKYLALEEEARKAVFKERPVLAAPSAAPVVVSA